MNNVQTLTGACLCGAITYAIDHAQTDVADICHCTQCRRASGAASLPWVQVPPSRFRITKGAAKPYASSAHATRWFCGDCGTPLYMTDDENRSIGITIGSLDQPEAIHPTVHCWLSARLTWAALEDLPGHAQAPPYDL